MTRLCVAVASAAVIVGCQRTTEAPKSAEQAHVVKVWRPLADGVLFHFSHHETKQQTLPDSSDTPLRRATLAYEGQALVVQAKDGRAIHMNHTVSKLQWAVDNEPVQRLPTSGTVISAKVSSGKARFYIRNEPVGSELAAILDEVFPHSGGESFGWDEWFPPKGKRRVGDRWSMDPEAALSDAVRSSALPATATASGTAQLMKVSTFAGTPVLIIHYDMTFKGVDAKAVTGEAGWMRVRLDVTVPIDENAILPQRRRIRLTRYAFDTADAAHKTRSVFETTMAMTPVR